MTITTPLYYPHPNQDLPMNLCPKCTRFEHAELKWTLEVRT